MSRKMLGPDQIDDLGRAVIHLAREIWIVKDRQRITEALLKERGIDLSDDLARFQPDQALEAELAAEREAFVAELMAKLVPDENRQ